jgi:hypothetical protein
VLFTSGESSPACMHLWETLLRKHLGWIDLKYRLLTCMPRKHVGKLGNFRNKNVSEFIGKHFCFPRIKFCFCNNVFAQGFIITQDLLKDNNNDCILSRRCLRSEWSTVHWQLTREDAMRSGRILEGAVS